MKSANRQTDPPQAGNRPALLLSAYDALSHRLWRAGVVAALGEYDWTVTSLPARHFPWRIRGNALSWALDAQAPVTQRFGLVLCTGMVDLATLKGLAPSLAHVPTVAYFHENQFAYPPSASQAHGIEPQMVNLYTALAADRVLFNSAYNRDTLLQGVGQLLARMPDAVPPGVVDTLAAKSSVLPVGIPDDAFAAHRDRVASGLPPKLVWNHRWEYDKAPERLLAALRRVRAQGGQWRLYVLGQRFRNEPEAMSQLRAEFGHWIEVWGPEDDRDAYLARLGEADAVVSTALHDFQGLAILEGVAAGCVPIVPDRLAYPELLPPACRYRSYLDDAEAEADALADHLLALERALRAGERPEVPDVTSLRWHSLAPAYRDCFAEAGRGAGRTGERRPCA